jgi:hypothetical protein
MTHDPPPVADIATALRIAGPEDYQEIFRLSCGLHAEHAQHPFSEEKCKQMLWRGCNRDNAIIGVIGPSNDIKAMIFLDIGSIYYSDEVQLYEQFNYVRSDCRKSDYAKRMILFAKKCADETGLDLLIGIISDVRLEAKERLYQRHLPKGGVWFNYRPKKPAEDAAVS